MARLTLNGMYQYDPTLFDGMILPEGYDRDALMAEIMKRSGQLYPYHQVPPILKADIRLWFSRNYLNFDRIMEALTAEYDPIENYNRHEQSTTTPNLTDKSTLSGKDSDQLSGTDTTTRSHTNYKETVTYSGTDEEERQVSAFDSSIYQPSEKTITGRANRQDEKSISGTYADATQFGKKNETTYGKVDTVTHTGTEGYSSHIHGNIGVVSSQAMITAELELRKFDIYSDIAARFEHEFIVQVY